MATRSSVVVLTALFIAMPVVLVGCPDHAEQGAPWDDQASGDDDETGDDDDDGAPDICDGHAGEILCDGDTEIVCDEHGDIASTRDCDVEEGEFCFAGLGCVECYPGDRRCDGTWIEECDTDGQGWSDLENCDSALGLACVDGVCVDLCAEAAEQERNDGCSFLAVDTELSGPHGEYLFGIVVANPSQSVDGYVDVEQRDQGNWILLETRTLPPGDAEIFEYTDSQLTGSCLSENGYRITSNIPVFAWQFNPIQSRATTDASLLFPTAPGDVSYRLPGWGPGVSGDEGTRGSLNVVAEVDGTEVSVTPSVATASGTGVPTGEPGTAMTFVLDQGDNLQIVRANHHESLAGTLVASSNHPVAAFSGHSCAYVPADSSGACNHLEEQVLGQTRWGTEYLAARIPHRRPAVPEDAHWQLVAGEGPVSLVFEADPAVVGLPGSLQLDLVAGEVTELQVSGDDQHPGDFLVTGDGPFLLTQYTEGWGSLVPVLPNGVGDPCMAQTVPVKRFRDDYMTYAPEGWNEHFLVLTRSPQVGIWIDGVNVSNWPHVSYTVTQDYEVLHVPVSSGVHNLQGEAPFGLLVMGWGSADAYCYPGGFESWVEPGDARGGGRGGGR